MKTNMRFLILDSIRGISALAVVIFHYHHFFLQNSNSRPGPDSSTFPYSSFLEGVFNHGHAVVQLFWIISGFVFYHVYLNKNTTFKDFAINRFARLYPLHLITLILVAIIQVISLDYLGYWQIYGNNDFMHFILQLGFSSNWVGFSHGLSFNGPIWSVSLEIFIYLVFFFSLYFLKKFHFLATLSLIALCQVLWLNIPPNHLINSKTFLCGVYFFSGGLCYIGITLLKEIKSGFLLCIFAPIISLVMAITFLKGEALIYVFGVTTIILVASVDLVHPVKSKVFLFLGDISYSLYLVHVPIQMAILLIIDLFLGGGRAIANSYITLPIYLAVSIFVAWLANTCFEKPVDRYLRNFLKSKIQPVKLRFLQK